MLFTEFKARKAKVGFRATVHLGTIVPLGRVMEELLTVHRSQCFAEMNTSMSNSTLTIYTNDDTVAEMLRKLDDTTTIPIR